MKTYGPYTPVRQAGNTFYISGQVGIDPSSNKASKTLKEQTKQAMNNLRYCTQQAGLCMDDIVKVTIYLTDISVFSEVNDMYQSFFTPPRPARACVGVAGLPHLADVPLLIEIEAVAYKEQS